MQTTPARIKDRLLRALDAQYNVVDMGAVLEIITVLEKTPITKEALETTRLGKHINEFRRKTDNEALAKRAKDLVRRWRDMIMPSSSAPPPPPQAPQPPPQPPEPGGLNGAGITSGPGPGSSLRSGRSAATSPAMSTASSSPGLRKGPSLPPSPPAPHSSRASPRLPPSRNNHAPNAEAVVRTHASNKRLRKDVISAEHDEDECGPIIKRSRFQHNGGPSEGASTSVHSPYNEIGSALPAAAVTRSSSSSTAGASASKAQSPPLVSNTDIVKTKMAQLMGRSAKVKTTQELLDNLRGRGGGNTSCSSPPPPSSLAHDTTSRQRALNTLLAPSDEVSRNKTEHLAKFLSSQGDHHHRRSSSPSPPGSPTGREIRRILSVLPPICPRPPSEPEEMRYDEEGEEGEDEEESGEPKVKEVDPELLESVLSGGEIVGVTGNVDQSGVKELAFDRRGTVKQETQESREGGVVKTEVLQGDEQGSNVPGSSTGADGSRSDSTVFREWQDPVWRESYNNELFLVWPYVIID